MRSIAMLGSEEQKQRWLPGLARVEEIGAFALTEPEHGSESIALKTTARRDGDMPFASEASSAIEVSLGGLASGPTSDG